MKREIGFDPVAGRLRLTRSSLVDLRAVHVGAEAPTSAALRSAGLLQGGAVHPRLVPVVETAAKPLVRLVLDVASDPPVHCQGWVGERGTLLLVARSGSEDVYDATFLSRSLLPAQLARFAGLGPRASGKVVDPIELDLGLLEALLSGAEMLTPSQVELLIDPNDDVLPAWVEVLSALSEGAVARWRVGVWWNSHEESPAARSIEIIDSGAGLFLVSHVARGPRRFARARLHPVTPTQVWRLLCALVPRPDEVAEPLLP